jgi:hypothetical protein
MQRHAFGLLPVSAMDAEVPRVDVVIRVGYEQDGPQRQAHPHTRVPVRKVEAMSCAGERRKHVWKAP